MSKQKKWYGATLRRLAVGFRVVVCPDTQEDRSDHLRVLQISRAVVPKLTRVFAEDDVFLKDVVFFFFGGCEDSSVTAANSTLRNLKFAVSALFDWRDA